VSVSVTLSVSVSIIDQVWPLPSLSVAALWCVAIEAAVVEVAVAVLVAALVWMRHHGVVQLQ